MGKVHMNVALVIHPNRNSTVQAVANPSTRLRLGPDAAARLIKADHLDGYTDLTPSSSTSISAQSSNQSTDEPDAVAQEMTNNLRPSMSQSGEALLDITMPNQSIGASAHILEAKEEGEHPSCLRDLKEQPGGVLRRTKHNGANWKRSIRNRTNHFQCPLPNKMNHCQKSPFQWYDFPIPRQIG